jgi:hypothetical protein
MRGDVYRRDPQESEKVGDLKYLSGIVGGPSEIEKKGRLILPRSLGFAGNGRPIRIREGSGEFRGPFKAAARWNGDVDVRPQGEGGKEASRPKKASFHQIKGAHPIILYINLFQKAWED